MEPFPPQQPSSAAENETPQESRLLTRRLSPLDQPDPPRQRATVSLHDRFAELNRRLRRKKEHRTRRWRRLVSALLTLACVGLLCVLVFTLSMRHAMRASLPQLDGTLQARGLQSAVQVVRDLQGVPSIRAASLDDMLFAQGFVTAQDRLWQMDALRRHAAGELAEILGPGLVDHDRQQRTLQLRAVADHAVATMTRDERHQFEAYARGVNAFLAISADHLPVEFHLLHYKPREWTPRDSVLVLLVMWQDLTTEYPRKLNREALSAHLPTSLLNDLYPVGSWRDRPPTQPATDLAAPKEQIEQIPLDSTQSSLRPSATPTDLLHGAVLADNGRCTGCKAGSNNWAVSAARSASGAPLLSNDMHLGLSMPSIWYEASLHAPAFDVAGFTLPGLPFVLVGRNAHVAWGFTNLGADVQDLRIEHLRGTGQHTEFERPDGSWAAVEHHIEPIHVRLGHDVTLDVLTTTHTVGSQSMTTPIITPLYPSEHRALSLAWSLYDPTARQPQLFAMNSATSGADLVTTFLSVGGPSLNLIWADDQHHIGYHALGFIPVRGSMARRSRTIDQPMTPAAPPQPTSGALPEGEEGDDEAQPTSSQVSEAASPAIDYTIGSAISPVPVDALDAGQQWAGYIPYADLPAIVDPASGVLATANARITPNDYPYAVANEWADPYRLERIHRLLDSRTGLTPAAMLAIETDVHSEYDLFLAQRLAYAVDHASKTALGTDARLLKSAADLLRDWNGELTTTSAPAAIVAAVRTQLWSALLAPQIRAHDKLNAKDRSAETLAKLYTWQESNTALEGLLNHTPARWLPAGFANWNDFLASTLAHALKAANAPSDLTRWNLGTEHPVEINHPVFSAYPLMDRLLGTATGTGVHAIGGDSTTVKANANHFGPSERFTADLANTESTTANITTGESGNPASAWYLDQFLPWLNGTTFSLPLHRPQAAHTLTLVP